MKFVIDCLGGDNSPRANVLGALKAMAKYPDLSVVFTGVQEDIERELAAAGQTDRSRIEIVHAPEAITGEDKPTDAIRLKKESSMVRGLRLLREKGVEYAETNLNLEDNRSIINMWKRFHAVQHKKRRSYVKRLNEPAR